MEKQARLGDAVARGPIEDVVGREATAGYDFADVVFGEGSLAGISGAFSAHRAARPQGNGWTLLESVRSDRDLSAMPVIVCASDPSLIQARSPLLRRPPETSVFLKPFNPEALLKMIRATLHPGQ